MTFWFFPLDLTVADEEHAIIQNELVMPAAGVPDLSKAYEPRQLESWLVKIFDGLRPEQVARQCEHYWRIANEVLPGDFLVIVDAAGSALIVGEIAGAYRYETRAEGAFHVLPIEWQCRKIPLNSISDFDLDLRQTGVREITQSKIVGQIKLYIPFFRRRRSHAWKWISIIILISELIYFWPH